jgi:hypothetical protein
VRPSSAPVVAAHDALPDAGNFGRSAVAPIARRPERRWNDDDPPAILAALRARIRAAVVGGDLVAEAAASARLARTLLMREQRLDEAVAAARRALSLRPSDDELRGLLSDALRALGEPGLAAATLRPRVDAACARAAEGPEAAVDGLLTIGDLLLRAGDADGAIESYRYVAVVAPDRPDGQERLAAARTVAPSAISTEVAARAYIGAARKHQLAGDDAQAVEALARAFELDPAGPLSAPVLADALDELGRTEAADAVRAEHARALSPKVEAAAVVHAARREKARARGDRTGCLATIFDELVDLVTTTPPGARGSAEARLQPMLDELPALGTALRRVFADAAGGAARIEALRAIAGRPTTTEPARIEALVEIVRADLGDDAAVAQLREHARLSRDPTALVDALVSGLAGDARDLPVAVIGMRAAELAGWADEQLGDPALAAWAWQRLVSIAPEERRAHDELRRLSIRQGAAEQELATAERETASDDPALRIPALRRLVAALFGHPERSGSHLEVIRALLAAVPGEKSAAAALRRLAGRLSPDRGRHALELLDPAHEDEDHRLARIGAAQRAGEPAAALAATRTEPPAGASEVFAAASLAVAIAHGEAGDLARALALFAAHAALVVEPSPHGTRVQAVILAAAARAARAAGDLERARALAERAIEVAPRETRAAVELAELAAAAPSVVPEPAAAAALERAIAAVGARGRWALSLAAIAESMGETPIAAAWTRRAWSLRPGDLEIARAWLARSVALGDPEIVAEVVETTARAAFALHAIDASLGTALELLFREAPERAEAVARTLLRLGAARLAPVRRAITAAEGATAALSMAVHEHWLACGANAAERPRVLLSIAEIARAAGDAGRAADAAARALAEPEVDPATADRAASLARELADTDIDADAELALRGVLSSRASRTIEQLLDRAPRARLSDAEDARIRAAADALRRAGRDLWDLSGDTEAAARTWWIGARALGAEGVDRLEADLAHFGGDDAARDALFELTREAEPEAATGTARAARQTAFRLRAWQRSLGRPPRWVEIESLAREAAARASDPAALLPAIEAIARATPHALHQIYEIAAGRASGRHGARGLHQRAARTLDRLGNADDALLHAVRAFAAYPSEGAAVATLERLARAAGHAEVAIAALVDAADEARDPGRRAFWLERAAAIAAREGSVEERLDLLLRLFLEGPRAATVATLCEAIRAAATADAAQGATRETWSRRLARAYRRVEAGLDPAARVAVAQVVADTLAALDAADAALEILARVERDLSAEDLAPLREVAESVSARDPEAARRFLARSAEDGGRLRAHFAWGGGDPDAAIELLAEHARPAGGGLDAGAVRRSAAGSATGTSQELSVLTRWAPAARDKKVLATAWERLGLRHGALPELEAAKALDEAGRPEEAAAHLVEAWRARGDAPSATVLEILELARAILPQASADAALETILVEDLQARPAASVEEAVARWRELAELRAIRLGDREGALSALVEAGRFAPTDDDLWSEISELAEGLGAHDRLAAALAQRVLRARPDRRIALLRKLARVLEHDLGRDAEAAERWAELVRLLPLDAEAADALERIAERRGDTTELLDLLRARAARLPVGHAERTRALRRIARELGGLQGRRGEVLSALREVHQQNPGDLEIALQLAALAREAGDLGTAAEALLRAFRVATRDAARTHLAIESAKILIELQDHETAARVLDEAATTSVLERDPRSLDLVRLQLDVATARADREAELLARIRLAELDRHAEARVRAAHWGAASRAAASLGDHGRARELAWEAARLARGDVELAAHLVELEFAHEHRYRGERGRDPELLELLLAIETSTSGRAEHLALVAFARAELLDAAQGPGAGYRDLHGWSADVRAQAPVELAIAERLAAEWSFGAATDAFERAFAGDLRGLRPLGPVALAAADAAARSNDQRRARSFLDLAARDPACRIDARLRAVELARTVGDEPGTLRALKRLAAEATGEVRAQALADQARLLRRQDPEAAAEAMRLAVSAAEEGSALRQALDREHVAIEGERRSLPPAPPPSLADPITANRSLASFDRAFASALRSGSFSDATAGAASRTGASDLANGGSANGGSWIAPQSDSEPPPEPIEGPIGGPMLATEASEPPRATTSSKPPKDTRRALSEHPRLTYSDEAEPAALGAAPLGAEALGTASLGTASLGTASLGAASLGAKDRPRLPSTPPRPLSSAALDLESLASLAADPTANVEQRVRAMRTLGEAAHEGGQHDDAIRHFVAALELGDVEAGDHAAEILASLGRADDLLLVRRRQAFLAPGDRGLLDGLHVAALGVRDHVFARAIDHVRRAFDPASGPVPPPPLEAQLDRPDLVVPLLERRANPLAAEALRIAWEHAQSVFRKDPTALRGIERVTGTIPLGRLVLAAGRLLGTARTPVHLRTRPGRDVEVVLVTPPTLVLGGDCREESADVRYVLGAGLLAATPSHCLLLAQPEDAARATWQALLSAFGPPEHGRGIGPEVGRLAAALWQAIPRASQRRLGELLGQAPPTFEVAIEGARQVARRGGLYLSGDVAAAVRASLAEVGEAALLDGVPDLAAIGHAFPKVADLLRLATSPEFAEARWRLPHSLHPTRRRSPSGGMPGP